MSERVMPVDQAQRDRIARSLDETLFVEAGAGTGKTTELVNRMVALLASGRATIESVAAITFTEAAASELRDKVRGALEDRVQDPDCEGLERERCLKAANGMDVASIQTLHSFAGSLLRERPLDAGLPPLFDTIEEIEAGLNFDRRWQEWLEQALNSAETGPLALRALTLGLRLEDLRTIAAEFHRSYDLLGRPFPAPEEPPMEAARALVDAAAGIRELLPLARRGPEDPLASHAGRVAALADRLGAAGIHPDAALQVLARWGRLSCSRGNQRDWDRDPATRRNGCAVMKDLLAGLEETKARELEGVRRAALLPLLESLRSFVLDYVEERRSEGKAEFHDLLVWARDLLRDHREARNYFRRRYSHILIDEFQDTDPIQAEIAFFLAGQADEEGAQEDAPADWAGMKPLPGKLFVVGDLKQSIYRFRRADIASLERAQGLLGREGARLVQNFRSQETVIAWVNAVFEKWMTVLPGLQAPYVPLTARWRPLDAAPPLGVHWAGGARDAPAAEVRREESEAVAALIRDIGSTPWSVRDEDSTGLRPAGYQDICVLLPARTGLRPLEHALDEAGVPYRVESQSLVLGTQDVKDLLDCLRAIDAPADQVALVAALRSSAFACSDVELLEFVENGCRLDYVNPGSGAGPVREALDVLLRYHRDRVWETPQHLIEKFVRERRMVETCFGRARPRERWRRLRFVVERARAFARVGGASLRAFLDWIEAQIEEGARMVEVPVPEADEDAVRIMTIHASKGLEFPIVFLAGLGARPSHRSSPAIFDRVSGAVEVRAGPARDSGFATAGYEAANEWETAAEAAERVRLMYVAATRARDHLIVSLFHSHKAQDSHAAIINRLSSEGDGLWSECSIGGREVIREPRAADGPGDAPPDTEAERAAWLERREAAIEGASRPASLAVTTLAGLAKEEAEHGEVPYRRGRGGTSLGRAVHSVLQSVDLATGEGLEDISRAQASAEGIPGQWREVASLARRAMQAQTVRRAVASGRYYREVFVSIPLNGALLEGFVDLLFEEDEGLTVVDYKTDALETEGELDRGQERYRLQAGAYALAVERATGRPVRRVVLVFLRSGAERAFDDVQELAAAAERQATDSLRGC